jgi:hypothetical protein
LGDRIEFVGCSVQARISKAGGLEAEIPPVKQHTKDFRLYLTAQFVFSSVSGCRGNIVAPASPLRSEIKEFCPVMPRLIVVEVLIQDIITCGIDA